MVEKAGYGEPFCKLSRDGVLMVDSNAVDFWKSSTSQNDKIELLSKMMRRYSVNVDVSSTIYDPQDFTPSFRIIIRYNNQFIVGRYIRISDFILADNSHDQNYDHNAEQAYHENMLYDILRETCQKTIMLNPKF